MRLAALALTLSAAVPPVPGRTLYPPEAWPIVPHSGSLDAVGGGQPAAPNPGIDIFAIVRIPVLAAEHAEVTPTGIDPRRGKVVELRATVTGRRLTLTYSHLHAIDVAFGDVVTPGQRLGAVGDTGQVPRGIGHLSFGVRAPDGLTPLDPDPSLRGRPTGEIECADPAADDPPSRLRAILSGERTGAPFLYPVACSRRP